MVLLIGLYFLNGGVTPIGRGSQPYPRGRPCPREGGPRGWGWLDFRPPLFGAKPLRTGRVEGACFTSLQRKFPYRPPDPPSGIHPYPREGGMMGLGGGVAWLFDLVLSVPNHCAEGA